MTAFARLRQLVEPTLPPEPEEGGWSVPEASPPTTPKLTFQQVDASIRALLAQDPVPRYQVGERLAAVRRLMLFREGGHSSFSRYLDSFETTTPRSLFRYLRLTACVPPSVACAYDPMRLEAVLRLTTPDRPGAPPLSIVDIESLDVLVVRDGIEQFVPFAFATTEELFEATNRKPRVEDGPKESLSRRLKRLSDKLKPAGAQIAARRKRAGQEATVAIYLPVERLEELERLLDERAVSGRR